MLNTVISLYLSDLSFKAAITENFETFPSGEMVALKMVDTQTLMHLDELQQLQDEVSALSALRHPRIIRLYSTQQVQSKFYFIMEFAPGGSLKELLDSQVHAAQLSYLNEQKY